MTEQPVLTPQQEKKSLSAKKAKKKPLKQILIKPQNNQYRPNASPEECELILDIINKLPRVIPEKTPISWSTIKNIPKGERKTFRAQHQQMVLSPDSQAYRKHLILGINKVTEHLENNNLLVVLLSGDINPFYMVHHVLELCVLRNVKILIIEDLRKALYTNLGIASTCMGITLGHKNDLLEALFKQICNICKGYPPPGDCNKLAVETVEENNTHVSKTKYDTNVSKPMSQVDNYRDLQLIRIDKTRVFKPERLQRNRALNADFIRFTAPEPVISKKFIGMQVAKMMANGRRDTKGRNKALGNKGGWFNPKMQEFKPNKEQVRKKFHK